MHKSEKINIIIQIDNSQYKPTKFIETISNIKSSIPTTYVSCKALVHNGFPSPQLDAVFKFDPTNEGRPRIDKINSRRIGRRRRRIDAAVTFLAIIPSGSTIDYYPTYPTTSVKTIAWHSPQSTGNVGLNS